MLSRRDHAAFDLLTTSIAAWSRRLSVEPQSKRYLMTIDPLQTRHRPELVHESAFIAAGAIVIGNVTLAEECSVWFNAVIRGDSEAIVIGAGTNVQDGCILHADPGRPCLLGQRVTLGHGAIVHGAIIDDDVLIGMRAVHPALFEGIAWSTSTVLDQTLERARGLRVSILTAWWDIDTPADLIRLRRWLDLRPSGELPETRRALARMQPHHRGLHRKGRAKEKGGRKA